MSKQTIKDTPVSIFDIALYILKENGGYSTCMKLQKLCYYCQSWYLAWNNNNPLFNEDFQAWRNGPICKNLYNIHSGSYTISTDNLQEYFEGSQIHQLRDFSDNQRNDINTVLEHYGSFDGSDLSAKTHLEEPWIKARGDLPEHSDSKNIITKESIGNFYRSLIG